MKTSKPQTSHLLKTIGRTLCAATLLATFLQTANAQVPLPLYEPFPFAYTNGTADETVAVPPSNATTFPGRRLGNGTTTSIWSIGGSPGGGSCLVIGGETGLSYLNLYQAGPSIGLFVRTNLTTANRSRGILFPTVNSGSLYASFLLNIQNSPTNNSLFATLDNATTGNGGANIAGVWLTSSNTLGISKSSSSTPDATGITPTLSAATTHLVVLKYTWNPASGDDEVALWVDPSAGSLNVPEGSVPAATVSITAGNDIASLSSFYIRHPQGGQVPLGVYLDEIRVATSWAEVTATQALCSAVSIVTPPIDKTVNEGISGIFSMVAGGTSPIFQWQVSTNGGTSWNNVSGGLGGASQTYQTPPTTTANNGNKYRVIANVACGGGSSITSAPVTLTVKPAVITPVGVVVDDVFQDGYNSIPYGISNSVWFASDTSLSDSGTPAMLGTVGASASTWLGYYTDDSVTNLPVHLAVGRAMKASLVFKASNIVSNGGNFRIGLFDYADGSSRVIANGFTSSPPGSTNVLGYMTTFNFGTNYTTTPFSLFARNNLGSTDLMGTTGNYLSLGSGPANLNGVPAFLNDTPYTVEFTLARKASDTIAFTTKVSGGGTNWSHTVIDSTYAYPRFDAIAVRPGSAATAADSFEFSRLLVEVVALNKIPLNIATSGTNVILSWTNSSYILQAAPEVTGPYANVTGATSPYTTPVSGTRRFFRLN